MNPTALGKRVDDLSKKLTDEPNDFIARYDDTSFTTAERYLLSKIDELREENNGHPSSEAIQANKDLILKASEILFKYTLATFRYGLLCFLGNPEDKVDLAYYNLHFHKFIGALRDDIKKAQNLSKNDREDLEIDLGIRLMQELFGLKIDCTDSSLEKTEDCEVNENEHYDPYYRT